MRISKWGIPGVMVPLSRYHLIPFDVILTGPHHHYPLRSLSVYWEERLSKTVESRCQGSEVPTLSPIAQDMGIVRVALPLLDPISVGASPHPTQALCLPEAFN